MSGSSLLTPSVEGETQGTQGHLFQRQLADTIFDSLSPVQRDRVRITTAPVGSTLPDISVTHLDYPEQPVNIECKVGSSQGGAVTWTYDGTAWTVSPQSRNGKAVCDSDPLFCATLAQILGTPVIMDRVRKIISKHTAFIPELHTDTVPFHTVPEIWSLILKETNAELRQESDGDIVWKFAVGKRKYWRNLNNVMRGSHFLAVRGKGLLRVNGAVFPEPWFVPSPTILEAPLIDQMTTEAGGDVEARFKRGGRSKGDKGIVQPNRTIFVIGQGENPPKVGDGVWVVNLTAATGFDPASGLIGEGIGYILKPPTDREVIGNLGTIHSLQRASRRGERGWMITCDFVHTSRGVTFETNLRISELCVDTPISLERQPTIFTNCIQAT